MEIFTNIQLRFWKINFVWNPGKNTSFFVFEYKIIKNVKMSALFLSIMIF